MPAKKLDNPARKLEIEDIIHIKNEDESWIYFDSELKFQIDILWLQGTIAYISNDMNEIILQEKGKTIMVSNCKNIPGGNLWIGEGNSENLGQYVMVFGEIQAIDHWTLNVKAIKISDLSYNTLHKQMWPHDVREAKLMYADEAKNKYK